MRSFVFLSVLVFLIFTTAAKANPAELRLELAAPFQSIGQIAGEIRVQGRDGQWNRLTLGDVGLMLVSAPSPVQPPLNDPDQLPDTDISIGSNDISRAWFARPTTRYNHAVLGDNIEAGSLKVALASGERVEYVLPDAAVFEDRVVRLADLDGDGRDELIAVKSDLTAGASVILLGVRHGRLTVLAEAPPIGRAHRWLNPVGVADFDGDGRAEIAVIITPHIGGTLQLYEWRGERLVAGQNIYGFSNHEMGSRELGLSAIADVDGDGLADIIVPDAARRRLKVVSFANDRTTVINEAPVHGDLFSGLFTTDLDGDGAPETVYAGLPTELVVVQWRQALF